MKNRVLTIEQMQHLESLGVDVSKGSIYWARRAHGSDIRDESKGEWFLSLQKNFLVRGFISYETIPTFTLHDMLEIMPPTLYSDKKGSTIRLEPISYFYKHILTVTKDIAGYMVEYRDYNKGVTLTYDEGRTALEAAYNMLCWLAENKLLGKEEKHG